MSTRGATLTNKMKLEKGLCILCSTETKELVHKNVTELKTDEFWPYVQKMEWSRPYFPYFSKTNTITTSSMCPICFSKVEKVTKYHRKILNLQQKLDDLKYELDQAVKGVHESIKKKSKSKAAIKEEPPTKNTKIKKAPLNGSERKRSFDEMMSSSASGTEDFIFPEVRIKIEPLEALAIDYNAATTEFTSATTTSSLPSSIETGLEGDDAEHFPEDVDEVSDAMSETVSTSEEEPESEPPPPKRKIKPKDPEWDPKARLPKRPSSAKRKNSAQWRRKKHMCLLCKEKYLLTDLQEHMKDHVGDMASQCPTCLITFPSRLSATYYSKNHRETCKDTVMGNITCEVCKEEILAGRAFRHFETHETSEKNFPCPMPSCSKAFTWKQRLELHVGDHELNRSRTEPGGELVLKNESKSASQECEVCGESQPLSTALFYEHMVSHVGIFAFQCPMEKCRKAFASRYTKRCISHQSFKRRGENYCKVGLKPICEECGEEFDELLKLRRHLKRHEDIQKNFTCPISECGKKFSVKQAVEFHLKSHVFYESLQTCSLCKEGKKSLTPFQMEAHLINEHGILDVVRCGKCPFVFDTHEKYVEHAGIHVRSGLKCHLCSCDEIFCHGPPFRQHYFKEHQIGKEYLCEHCAYSAFSQKTLNIHVDEVHKGHKKFCCEICEDKPSFRNHDSLNRHNHNMHQVGVLYSCKFCSERFTTRCKRDQHERRMHLGEKKEKKHPCPDCGMMFVRRSRLVQHIDAHHSTEKKYQCTKDGCEERFKTKQSLNRHIQEVHVGTAVVCEICGKTLKNKKMLEVHMRIHTGERPFLCKICGLKFRQHSSLYTHNKSHERKGDAFVPKGTFDRTPKTE